MPTAGRPSSDSTSSSSRTRSENPFPQSPSDQLWGAIGAVFGSWMNARAIAYRQLHDIPASWGTAVNVQAMVFGNMGETSATGVAFTRNPSTGEKALYGEFLVNAQGEDVVAGIRTPQDLTEAARIASGSSLPSLETLMPEAFAEFRRTAERLESHYRDMQDVEFTIERGKLWMLQTRAGKRTAKAALKIAVDMAAEGLITREEAIGRIEPNSLDQLLHPTLDPSAPRTLIARGLPASPGAATGEIVFTAEEAERLKGEGREVILVRNETSPEDIHGMVAALGVLTARGGMTSHAAVVARGMGKPCVCGAGALKIDGKLGTMSVAGKTWRAGDVITIDGGSGEVFDGRVPTLQPELTGDFATLMGWADAVRRMRVRANAETPNDARVAREFGAEGIGLCRTEHMFFDGERILAVREMILASDSQGPQRGARQAAADAAAGFLRALHHHARPAGHHPAARSAAARVSAEDRRGDRRGGGGDEGRPGAAPRPRHRAHRIQSDARPSRLPAADHLSGDRRDADARHPRGGGGGGGEDRRAGDAGDHGSACRHAQRARQRARDDRCHGEVARHATAHGVSYTVGTMIELPRAALRAQEIAESADFFSFGTNDLTQTTFGISRDDAAGFIGAYQEKGLIEKDPFVTLDTEGVGVLVRVAANEGRKAKPDLKLGICGEHGGDPASIRFCDAVGLDYVSCSPFRVPIARLAAAQAALASGQASTD